MTTQLLAIAGVGPSGAPTITVPIVLGLDVRSDRDGGSMSANCDASFSKGALLVGRVQLAPSSLPRANWNDLVAPLEPLRLPLAFP